MVLSRQLVVCFYFSYEICFKLQLFKLLDPSALQPFHESQHGRSLEVAHIRSSTRRCADNKLVGLFGRAHVSSKTCHNLATHGKYHSRTNSGNLLLTHLFPLFCWRPPPSVCLLKVDVRLNSKNETVIVDNLKIGYPCV
jgi:hypothetical protein